VFLHEYRNGHGHDGNELHGDGLGNGDQGADPNKLVAITDNLSAGGPTPPTGETFTNPLSAGNLETLRGVSFTPGT
jgi:hypothetical protein